MRGVGPHPPARTVTDCVRPYTCASARSGMRLGCRQVMGRSATAKLAACCTPGLYAAFGCQVSSCVLHAVCHAARCMLRITLYVARRTPLVSCGMFDAKCRPGHTRE